MIKPINKEHREEVNKILKEEWDAPIITSLDKAIDTTDLPGFVSLSGERINGVVTYIIEGLRCEIVTLNSLDESIGVGTALINAVLGAAKENKCDTLWLLTTNDNINAIRFYQKKGFDLVKVHYNIMDKAREVKPSIPLVALNGIPIKHEFEFEIKIVAD